MLETPNRPFQQQQQQQHATATGGVTGRNTPTGSDLDSSSANDIENGGGEDGCESADKSIESSVEQFLVKDTKSK